MVGTISVTNSSNFNKLKFVKVLNKPRIAHIVMNTFWSTDCPTLNSNSFALDNLNVLTLNITIVVNTI
jgi:hypothetical protein